MYLYKIRKLTKAIKMAVAFFNWIGVKSLLLILLPICPPIKTVTNKIEVKFQSIIKLGFEIYKDDEIGLFTFIEARKIGSSDD